MEILAAFHGPQTAIAKIVSRYSGVKQRVSRPATKQYNILPKRFRAWVYKINVAIRDRLSRVVWLGKERLSFSSGGYRHGYF